jgi:predicted O-methyltransferase YrrM
MNFTHDWFSHNVPNFELCMQAIPEKKCFLEIGAFEGRATCWLLENGLAEKGSIVCIDPFSGSVEHGGIDFTAVEARFWSNTSQTRKDTQVVSLFKKPSYDALAEMIGFKYAFDFIYIDGSHAPDMALTDACMSWGLLKQGGVMLFDDYQYPHEPTKVGIDGFLNAFGEKFKVVAQNYQYGIQKL